MIAIIDIGLSNLDSVCRAFKRVGVDVAVTKDADRIMQAVAVILPGVGAFGDGMAGLRERGLIEPIDDIRETNPATNAPLMQALADHLREIDYDLKAFTRTLLNSRVYQLSSLSNTSNEDDYQNFSHAAYKSLPAEVLLDAICQSTGVTEKFNGWPKGFRAIQVWDNRMPNYFFRIFGRPVRASVCECERSNEPSIAQALHLMNSPEIQAKLSTPGGTVEVAASFGEALFDDLTYNRARVRARLRAIARARAFKP